MAKFAIATAYFLGVGVVKDPVEALKWLKDSASNGIIEAQYQMFKAYESSNILNDDNRAQAWLEIASNNNHQVAISTLNKRNKTAND